MTGGRSRNLALRVVAGLVAAGWVAAATAGCTSAKAPPSTGPAAQSATPTRLTPTSTSRSTATGLSASSARSASASASASATGVQPRPKPTTTPGPNRTPLPTPASATPRSSSAPAVVVPAGDRPVIVIDPGHSRTINAVDPATGLNVSDYENEPEMTDVFSVAELVRARLTADRYRVVMTKNSVTERVSLGQRAAIANQVHAALALSIHDQAGPNGGIGFDQGNNTVYYQSVGDYRTNSSGRKIYFTDNRVAGLSQTYGQIFRTQRAAAEGHSLALLGNVGYDLGSRGLPAGNIWLVQLLSDVPWIYNEAGGNSPGMSGLNAADQRRYADGLVAGVEHCIPVPR